MKHTPSTVNEVFCGVGKYYKYWGMDHEIWYPTGILWIPCVFLFGCSALFFDVGSRTPHGNQDSRVEGPRR